VRFSGNGVVVEISNSTCSIMFRNASIELLSGTLFEGTWCSEGKQEIRNFSQRTFQALPK
jgi:hypothetical protein